MAPAAASIVSGEKPNSNKKGWREDAVKDETSTTKGINAAGKQHKSKPDQEAHKKAVREIETGIDELREKLNTIKDQISRSDPKNASPNEGQQQLRNRLAEIRKIQNDAKQSRVKIYDQLDSIKSGLTRKMNDLKLAKEKTPFKSSKDVNEKIAKLEKEIESGKLKLIEEKRVVTEINGLKKSLKSVETFHAQQEAIDADKKALDEIRKQLEDPETKSLGDEYKKIQDELNAVTKSKDAEYAQRKVLFDSRNALQKEMDDLRNNKRTLQDDFRTAMNEWYNAAQEERERKQVEYKRQQEEATAVKRAAAAAAEREAAEFPAFSDEIAGCNALLTYLQQQSSEKINAEASASAQAPPEVAAALAGTKQPEAFLMKKKKTDEDFFVGGKYARKQSGKKAASKESTTKAFKLPLAVMERFWQIKVDVPMSSADIPKTLEALKEKRDWYEKESPRVTAENKAKAEAKIAALANAKTDDESVPRDKKVEASNVEDNKA